MKKIRRGTIIFVFLIVVLIFLFSADFLSDRVFCYDTKVAHPAIAQLAVELYNQKFDPDLDKKDLTCILSGAMDEDTPTRWLNHFFDPVHNKGLKGLYLPAKDWSISPNVQSSFSLGDQSWQRALSDYKKGDRERALKSLGHILHLVADMAVPAHTRDDIHVYPGDSYEQYLKKNWLEIAKDIDTSKFTVVNVKNLNQAFVELANYSNNNFYSDDTVEDSNYRVVEVEKSRRKKIGKIDYTFSVNLYSFGEENYLYGEELYFDWQNKFLSSKKLKSKLFINHPIILKNHASFLVPKAVSYSAGVIKLFFSEADSVSSVEKEKLPLFRQNLNGFADLMLGKIINGVQSLSERQNKNENSNQVYGEEIPVITNKTTTDINEIINNKNEVVIPTDIPVYHEEKKSEPIKEEVVTPLIVAPVIEDPAPEIVVSPPPVIYHGGGGKEEQTPTSSVATSTVTPEVSTTTPEVSTSTLPIETPTSTVTTTIPTEISTSTPTSTIPTETASSTPTSTIPIEIVTSTPTSTLPTETATSSIVVINEIAWSGTGFKTTNDEWIELYNNSQEEIDLTGWTLDVSGRVVSLTGKISSGDFYLMERTSDNTVKDINADLIFTLPNGLRNVGEKMVLKNADGEIVDQVDCTNGWFFGTDGSPSLPQNRYRTMERINPNNSGNNVSNWRNNIGAPVFGKNNFGGGEILGTPRQPNNNYWVLTNLTYNYYNQIVDNVFYLTKEHNPYIFDNNFIIPSGYKIIIEPGVVLVGLNNFSYINVNGELEISGTEDDPVFFTSARDHSKVQREIFGWTGDPAAGDWSRIEVNSGGKLVMNHASLYYGGNSFKKGTGWVYGTINVSQVIRNTGGEAKIENSYFYNSFISPEDSEYNAIIWTENISTASSTSIIKNNIFDGGWVAVKNFGQTNGTKIYSEIVDNSFNNFLGTNGPVVLKYFFPIINNNLFLENNKNSIYLDCLEMSESSDLEKGDYIINGGITVPVEKTLTLSPGVNFVMKNSSDIIVNGVLYSNGSKDEPINFNPEEGYAWGKIIFKPGSSGVLNYSYLRDGGMTNTDPSTSGMVIADNAIINFDNVLFSDAERPQNMVYLKDSTTKIKDSKISWNSEFSSPTRSINGIFAIGGTLELDNVYFDQMDIGINSLADFIFKSNMEDEHFTNIKKYNWWPEDLFTPVVPIEVLEQG